MNRASVTQANMERDGRVELGLVGIFMVLITNDKMELR